MQLRVAQWVEDTEAEGPGRRFALWVQGCSLRCAGCCNPDMFARQGGTVFEVSALVERVRATSGLEGLSVLGGEPFEQAEPLAQLCAEVRAAGLSVMVFTGYTLAELRARAPKVPGTSALLGSTDLLVDGRYMRELADHARRWVGSTNQQVHRLTARYAATDERFTRPNTVELRLRGRTLTINGWPDAAADALRP
jgi:anaerobic ribonucleoside-triphosphate reductase activating protein